MYKKPYRVTFITKKGGTKTWAIDIEADNQKRSKIEGDRTMERE